MVDPADLLDDPHLPAARLLLGSSHGRVLEQIAAASDASVRSARIGQVRYVPGRSITAQYEVELTESGGTSRATFVAMAGIDVPEPHTAVPVDGAAIAVWRFPHDPFLPGLATAVDVNAAGALLAALGAPPGTITVRRRAYRAGRRSVIQVTGSEASAYLKVVRRPRASDLQALHTSMSAVLPVPRSLGWSGELGIVALQALPGLPLRKAIESGTTDLPAASTLIELLDRIPAGGTAPVAGPVSRVAEHARLLGAVQPELRDRLAAIEAALAEVPAEPTVPVHGDFHSSQVLVDGDRPTGLVDIDTVGMGARSDDLAALLAHLGVLSLAPAHGRDFARYGALLLRTFDDLVDPVGLRLRVAAMIVGFATGPFRVQLDGRRSATEQRLSLAERWLEAARVRRRPSRSFPAA